MLYVEARFFPHLMLSVKHPEVTADDVVKTVLEAVKEGEKLYGTKVGLILSGFSSIDHSMCFEGTALDASADVLKLCQKYKDEGVVGMDFAGPEISPYSASKLQCVA